MIGRPLSAHQRARMPGAWAAWSKQTTPAWLATRTSRTRLRRPRRAGCATLAHPTLLRGAPPPDRTVTGVTRYRLSAARRGRGRTRSRPQAPSSVPAGGMAAAAGTQQRARTPFARCLPETHLPPGSMPGRSASPTPQPRRRRRRLQGLRLSAGATTTTSLVASWGRRQCRWRRQRSGATPGRSGRVGTAMVGLC